MLTRNLQLDSAERLSFAADIEERMSLWVEFDVGGVKVGVFAETESDHMTVRVGDNPADERIGFVGDDVSVFGNELRKPVKGSDDMIDILEIIQMIGIDIEDNFDNENDNEYGE